MWNRSINKNAKTKFIEILHTKIPLNADLKISLYVHVRMKIIPQKFYVLNPSNSRFIYP